MPVLPYLSRLAAVLLLLAGPILGSRLALAETAAIDMLSYDLRPLNELSHASELHELRGELDVLVFFEPDCSWCFKQTQLINHMYQECPDFKAAAIGVNGSRRSLMQEVLRLRPDFPAYQIDANMLAELGAVEGTPLMIFVDDHGDFLTYTRGYQKREIFESLLKTFNPEFCPTA